MPPSAPSARGVSETVGGVDRETHRQQNQQVSVREGVQGNMSGGVELEEVLN
jgi:hypothetical protein